MPNEFLNVKDYNQFFREEILSKLNPAQAKAVDQIDGPVLVVAGPGTGKTHILSARIGNILLQTDTDARNILCLTFTEAGVVAMRKRLVSFIGPEAHRIPIYTFHSFCNRIIQDNLELFGTQYLEPLNDLERVEIIRSIIDGLPVDHILKIGRSNIYFYQNHLQSLFRLMKQEKWSPELIRQKTKAYKKGLKNNPEYKYKISRGTFVKGDLKEAKLQAEEHRISLLEAAVELFPIYEEQLKNANRYDYEDMILWVLNAFKDHPFLLRSYQERYLYLLIDEFQDTNGSQNELIQQLVAFWDNPNLFVVGDDDQSIFEFQGARLKNITEFYKKFEASIEVVPLTENYRSSTPILDTASYLIQRNENRIFNKLKSNDLLVQKKLIAKHEEFSKISIGPKIKRYYTQFQEEVGLIEDLKRIQLSGASWEQMAIIYAKHRQAESIIQLLEKEAIPYQVKRRRNVLNEPFVIQLRKLIDFVSLELKFPGKGHYLIYELLHFDCFQVPRGDIQKIGLGLLGIKERRIGWMEILKHKEKLLEFGIVEVEQVLKVGAFLDTIVLKGKNLPLNQWVEYLVNQSGLLNIVLKEESTEQLVPALKAFVTFVWEEFSRRPRMSPVELSDLLKRMDENFLPIEYNASLGVENGVNLLTAHGSKGLEFEYVLLFDVTKDQWEPRSRGSSFQFYLPETITYSGEEDPLEARRRLFFVAITRAQRELIISYSLTNKKGKSIERARFVDEIQEFGVKEEVVDMEGETFLSHQIRSLEITKKPLIQLPQSIYLKEMVESFVLSASALNQFLECPLGFYYTNILKIPGLISEAANYGTAIHNALDGFFKEMKKSTKKIFPSEKKLIHLFDKEIALFEHQFTKVSYERFQEQGRNSLIQLYRTRIKEWSKYKKVELEFPVWEAKYKGVPIKGIIDKLIIESNQKIRIIDYKTGSHNQQKLRGLGKSLPYGGNYWRQLHFYKILLSDYYKGIYQINMGEIVYVDPDKQGGNKVGELELREADTLEVGKMITDVYKKIQHFQFDTGCGEPDCKWCNFVSANQLVDKWVNPETESLDDFS